MEVISKYPKNPMIEKRNAAIGRALAKGASFSELAERHGISIHYVRLIWKQYRAQNPDTPSRLKVGSQNVKRDKKIVSMRRQGMTLRDIGEEFGLSHERVRQIVERHEINETQAADAQAAR